MAAAGRERTPTREIAREKEPKVPMMPIKVGTPPAPNRKARDMIKEITTFLDEGGRGGI